MYNKEYYKFLCSIVKKKGYDYEELFNQLYSIDFYSLIKNDDSRELDGIQLREAYMDNNPNMESINLTDPCSVFEMLIGVADRIVVDLDGTPNSLNTREAFWLLMTNLKLNYYDNIGYECSDGFEHVSKVINILLKRKYKYSGDGGLFPLAFPKEDQRKVEIWYQMSYWINENYPI